MLERTLALGLLWIVFLLPASGCSICQSAFNRTENQSDVPGKASDICPLLVGQTLPEITLRTPNGEAFDLNAAMVEKHTLLIFYRGGWCPYCSRHLSELQGLESTFIEMGVQIMAISPDRPEKLNQAIEKQGLRYRLLSDSHMNAAKAIGIAFRVDDETVQMYKTD